MNWHWNSEYVRIYNQEIYTAAEERPIVHVFEQMLDAGTYYIKVLPYGNNTGRYTLLSEEKIVTKSIKISDKSKVVAGKSVQLSATLSPSNITDPTIEWSSGNAGRVNITASAKDGSNVTKTVSLIVTPKRMSASSYSGRYFSVKKGKYYIRTRSYLKVGKKYYYGDWNKVRTIKVKR